MIDAGVSSSFIINTNDGIGGDWNYSFNPFEVRIPNIRMAGTDSAIRWEDDDGLLEGYIWYNQTGSSELEMVDQNGPVRVIAGAAVDNWQYIFGDDGVFKIPNLTFLKTANAQPTGDAALRWNDGTSDVAYLWLNDPGNTYLGELELTRTNDNVRIIAGSSQWEFNTDGTLTGPGGIITRQDVLADKMQQVAQVLGATPAQLTQIQTIMES